jgi:hypothetical protein
MTPSRIRNLLLLVPALAVLVAGCGTGNPNAPGNVSGSVSYKGKPVTGGSVQFVAADGAAYVGSIGSDGTYAISDVAAGEMVVVVETESINPKLGENEGKGPQAKRYEGVSQQPPPGGRANEGPNSTAANSPKYMKIPEKYGKKNTSPLTYTVKAGRNVHSIELD